mmetsp:Transcript_23861/g.74658  ORF Transcript_23861/g.74658 Transcript_23861/m.74658 type:complete len:307 (+) Transcript_23861:481-1401(+)
MHLVHDHVFELLIENGAHEDVGAKRFASGTRVQQVLANVRVTVCDERLASFARAIGRTVILAKCSSVRLSTGKDAGLASDKFYDFPHGHATREAVRIHDEVRADAEVGEGHVFLRDDSAADAFLAVPRGELVSNLWATNLAQHNLDQKRVSLVGRQEYAVDDAWHGTLVRTRLSLVPNRRRRRRRPAPTTARRIWRRRRRRRIGRIHCLAVFDRDLAIDHDRLIDELGTDTADPVEVEGSEASVPCVVLALGEVRDGGRADRPIARAVRVSLDRRLVLAHDEATHESAIETRFIENDSVLDVVPRV